MGCWVIMIADLILADTCSSVLQQGTEGAHTNTLIITSCLSLFVHGEFDGSLPRTVQTLVQLTRSRHHVLVLCA